LRSSKERLKDKIMRKDNSRIVLINPVNPDPPPNYFGPPYGLSLIGANLLKHKKVVTAYDFDLEPLEVMLSAIPAIIRRDKPHYVGVAIQSCTRGPVYELIKAIRKIDKSIIIILGGPFASIKYELLVQNFPVDYIVIGDGEETLVELLDCLENDREPKRVNGIAFLKDDCVYITDERRKIINLDNLPYPAFHLFKHFDKKINIVEKDKPMPNFILGRRCTTLKNALLLLSSRGCTYNCNFCPMSKVNKDKIRFHSPEYFVDMVDFFYNKYNIRVYAFGDNFFTLAKKRVMKICDLILKKNLKILWSCMTRSDYVDAKMLSLMAKAGCFEISYGIESGAPKIQKRIGKNLDLAKTKDAFTLTKKAGIRSILMLMIGNTGESRKTIKETACYVKDIDPDTILVKITKVYPGTKVHDIFEKRGLLKKNYYLTDEHAPPSFTLAHSEEELEKFAQTIQVRTVILYVNNKCNNNCIFCYAGKCKNGKTFKEIKRELILASRRAEHIILGCGEFFLRKDFFQILNFTDQADIHHLYLYSNARMFYYKDLVQKIKSTKSLRKIMIPFFGDKGIHDHACRAKGAFSQTITGIKNLKATAPYIRIQACIFVSDSNSGSLFELAEFLGTSLGIDEFRFIFFKTSISCIKVNPENLVSMVDAVIEFKKIADFLKQHKKVFYYEGFPLCVLGKYKKNAIEPSFLFNEIVAFDKKIIKCSEKREREKQKFSFCIKCKENQLCEGVWKEYVRIYGNREFKPC